MKNPLNVAGHVTALRSLVGNLKFGTPGNEQIATRRTMSKTRRRRLRMSRVIGFGAIGTFILSIATVHASQVIHEGGRSAIAERLTRAIAARDTEGLRTLFVPALGDNVVHDIRLGELADRFEQLGALRGVRVQEAGSGRLSWVMVAVFAHGSQIERIRFIGDRVVAFSAPSGEMVKTQIINPPQNAAVPDAAATASSQ